jgi:galactose mutarotase-like enzyme
VYAQPSLNAVAIEPVSNVNNAFNLMGQLGATAGELGVQVLQPGESHVC